MSVSISADHVPLTPAMALDNCNKLVDFLIWPLTSNLNPEAWLENFNPDEKPFAAHLLTKFMYFCDDITNQLFLSAIQDLSARLVSPRMDISGLRAAWQQFLDTAIFTYVEGEKPNPTDSGFLFSRKIRQILDVTQNRIVSPADALARAIAGHTGAIIFVDDFVGSGNQFCETWERSYDCGSQVASFKSFAATHADARFFYAVAICTARGMHRIHNA